LNAGVYFHQTFFFPSSSSFSSSMLKRERKRSNKSILGFVLFAIYSKSFFKNRKKFISKIE